MGAVLQRAEFDVPMERVVADYSILQPVAEPEDEVLTYEVVAALDATRDHDQVCGRFLRPQLPGRPRGYRLNGCVNRILGVSPSCPAQSGPALLWRPACIFCSSRLPSQTLSRYRGLNALCDDRVRPHHTAARPRAHNAADGCRVHAVVREQRGFLSAEFLPVARRP
jgi:hypothetical protein